MVIWEASNDAKVTRLVYIAALAPDNDESVQKLIDNPTPDARVPPIRSLSTGQREMSRRADATVVESTGSHAIYESQTAAVAALIEKAALSGASTLTTVAADSDV